MKLQVLKGVTVHSQTEKYVKIIYTPHDGKMNHFRVSQIALNGWRRNLPSQWGEE